MSQLGRRVFVAVGIMGNPGKHGGLRKKSIRMAVHPEKWSFSTPSYAQGRYRGHTL